MAPKTTTTHKYKFNLPNYKVTVTLNKTTGKHFFSISVFINYLSIKILFLRTPNTVIKRDLQVLSVRQEVRNDSVTYRQRPDDHPNSLAKSLFQIFISKSTSHHNSRLKWYYPADLVTSTLQNPQRP
jgi:pyruvate-formate lyase